MAQKFEVGQEVMVHSYDEMWNGPKIVFGTFDKHGGGRYSYRGPTYTENPKGRYVGVKDPYKEWTCGRCEGTGKMDPDEYSVSDIPTIHPKFSSGVPTLLKVECRACYGKGICNNNPYPEYVINRSDKILTVEEYNTTVLAAKEERKRIAQEGEKRKQERIGSHIKNLIEAAHSENPELAVAEIIYKWGRASGKYDGRRLLYVMDSELYAAAGIVVDKERKKYVS